MVDSGSVCSLNTKNLANRILISTTFARGINTKLDRDLKTFSNEPLKVLGKILTTVTYNDWTCEHACLTVVEDEQKLIIERDLLNSLGLAVVQHQARRVKIVNNIDSSICKMKQTIASQFPHLVTRIGLSKTQVVKSKFIRSSQQSTKKVVSFRLTSNLELRSNQIVYKKKDTLKNCLVALTNTLYCR